MPGRAQFIQQGNKLAGNDVFPGSAARLDLGTSVALSSADGSTAIAGGPYDGNFGAAWVFTRSNLTWTQQGAKLVPSDAPRSAHFAGLGDADQVFSVVR
jgi:hypothetical protein